MSKLPNTATKEQRLSAHRTKMEWKKSRRASIGTEGHFAKQMARGAKPFANLSKNHPDYGCTHAEHAVRKAKRRAA